MSSKIKELEDRLEIAIEALESIASLDAGLDMILELTTSELAAVVYQDTMIAKEALENMGVIEVTYGLEN